MINIVQEKVTDGSSLTSCHVLETVVEDRGRVTGGQEVTEDEANIKLRSEDPADNTNTLQ